MHPHGQLPGAHRISSRLYEGGYLGDAAQLVRSGQAEAHDFLFFRGRYEWRTGELEEQLSRGEFIRPAASAPPDSEEWSRPASCRPAALATQTGRLALSWRAWTAHLRRCDPATAPLLRLRKSELSETVVRAAHSVGRVGRAGEGLPISEMDPEQMSELH